MPVASPQNVRCPSCGSRNPTDAERCRICTTPLHFEGTDSDLAYQRRLYRSQVSHWRPPRRRWPWVAAAVVALLAGNWYVFRLGPDWIHSVRPHRPGSDWTTYTAFAPRLTALLPGSPVLSNDRPGLEGVAMTVVDEDWRPVLDSTTLSPAALRTAESRRLATVAVAVAPSEGQSPALGASRKVEGLLAGVTLSDIDVGTVTSTPGVAAVEVTARYTGYPAPGRDGTVRARLSTQGETTALAATFFERRELPGLHEYLVTHLTLDP